MVHKQAGAACQDVKDQVGCDGGRAFQLKAEAGRTRPGSGPVEREHGAAHRLVLARGDAGGDLPAHAPCGEHGGPLLGRPAEPRGHVSLADARCLPVAGELVPLGPGVVDPEHVAGPAADEVRALSTTFTT